MSCNALHNDSGDYYEIWKLDLGVMVGKVSVSLVFGQQLLY